MKQKTSFALTAASLVAVAAMLTACGGGGGGGSSGGSAAVGTGTNTGTGTGSGTSTGGGTSTTTPTTTVRLEQTIGTWVTDCDPNTFSKYTAVIQRTAGTTDSVDMALTTDYYGNAQCTGNVAINTKTTAINGVDPAPLTSKYVATIDSPVVLTTGAAATTISVDAITGSQPANIIVATGTNLTHAVNSSGQLQWCAAVTGGTICVNDKGTIAAQSGVAGGLSVQGTTLYELSQSASGYAVVRRYTKQ